MTTATKPAKRPGNIHFSSGPCAKRPGWSLDNLDKAFLARSHRAKEGKARLKLAIDKTKALLGLPAGYVCGIVPASDTGAFEMAMWSMLGARGVDALAWESFGKGWVTDTAKQLKLKDLRVIEAEYGRLPDLKSVDFDRDVLFTWNGTTSGVRVPNGDWIAAKRGGLTFADATSAVFAQEIDWTKIDVATFSWQKVLGGEAAHGMLILSPRAIERLESYTPPWPLPKIFRLTKGGKFIKEVFEGETLNTPSMLCVEDYLDALQMGGGYRRPAGAIRPRRRQRPRAARLGGAHCRGWKTSPPIRLRAPTPRYASRSSIRLSPGCRSTHSVPSSSSSRRCSTRRTPRVTSPVIATRRPRCASGAARPSKRPTWPRSPPGSTGPSPSAKPASPRRRDQSRTPRRGDRLSGRILDGAAVGARRRHRHRLALRHFR